MLTLIVGASLCAQETSSRPAISPSARLKAAKTIFFKHISGSKIGYKAIISNVEGWGKYTVVDSQSDADLIATIDGPVEFPDSSDSRLGQIGPTGRTENSNPRVQESKRAMNMRFIVFDARNNVALWSGSAQVRSAIKQKGWEDNIVEAAQDLFQKFHDVVEPPPHE